MPHVGSGRALMWRLLNYVRYRPSKNSGSPNSASQPSAYGHPYAPVPPPTHQQWNAEEKQHRKIERECWQRSIGVNKTAAVAGLVSALVSICAAGAAIGGAIFALDALKASRVQATSAQEQTIIAQQSLVAANRAWLNVIVESNESSLGWMSSNAGMTINLKYKVRNEGNSPALNAKMSSRIFLRYTEPSAVSSFYEQECSRAPFEGFFVFKGEEVNGTTIVRSVDEEWQNLLKERKRYMPAGMDSTKGWIPVDLLVCVTYNISGETTPHYTGRLVHLWNMEGGVNASPFIQVGEDLNGGRLVLRAREYAGNRAN